MGRVLTFATQGFYAQRGADLTIQVEDLFPSGERKPKCLLMGIDHRRPRREEAL